MVKPPEEVGMTRTTPSGDGSIVQGPGLLMIGVPRPSGIIASESNVSAKGKLLH
jgi:hypothetical protein